MEGIRIGIGDVEVHIDISLSSGDVLVVDSENKTVKKNGEDVAPGLYTGENLPDLLLKYGDNVVKVTADDPGNTAYNANVAYTGRYGGL